MGDKTKVKLVSISLSSNCIKKPRCSFCYNRDKHYKYDPYSIWSSLNNIQKQYKKVEIAIEYSGLHLDYLFAHNEGQKFVLTTMPQIITKTFVGAIKNCGCKAISLSFDSQKCPMDEWIQKAKIANSFDLPISCNYLIEHIPMNVPNKLLKNCNQLNLLTMKPTGQLSEKELKIIALEILGLQKNYKVVMDNCLGVQLGYVKECKAGKDFIHILPDGTIEPCSFGNQCFLWKKQIEYVVNEGIYKINEK